MSGSPDRRRPHGELANEVLTILRGSESSWLTVRDVHDELARRRPIAYTTVLTVMRRLAQQGLLDHEQHGRSGRFRVARRVDPAGARTMVDHALTRFGTVAVAQFVERSREDPELLAELRRQLGMDDDVDAP